MTWKIAVVGATGNVGREMLNVLAERIPGLNIVALASRKSMGVQVSYGEKILKCQDLAQYDFTGTDVVLMSAGSAVSKEWSPKIAKAGAVVIDNSSAWRMDPGVPLVVPEVNGHTLARYAKKNIVANPNCSTIHRVVALKALHDEANIMRIVTSTYQSVSGAGKDGMDELFTQSRAIFVGDAVERHKFPKQIAFNVIPQVDSFLDDGGTKEEEKQATETRKILGPDIKVQATCVRVAVFRGHGEACTVEFERPISATRAKSLLRNAPGVMLVDRHEDGGYITPLESVGDDEVYVSRVRTDPTVANGLSLWIAADNLRKGAALNAVQIAELLIAEHLKKKLA
ncbi:Aspartate-semialdehyde dehydrogenase 2 [Alphaproteobacteria bacterium SO-S41]|nr:Aspartate-semialdehyde dehydrogenase 2 [Alphaproteobacteria bacterium SO-S41]